MIVGSTILRDVFQLLSGLVLVASRFVVASQVSIGLSFNLSLF
jgi:hypothetical protein